MEDYRNPEITCAAKQDHGHKACWQNASFENVKTNPVLSPERGSEIEELYRKQTQLKKIKIYADALNEAERREREVLTRGVNFKVKSKTAFGENVRVVGSIPALGKWDPKNSVPMMWTPGNIWTVSLRLADDEIALAKQVDYKYLIERSGVYQWEGGKNRSFDPEKIKHGKTSLREDTFCDA